MYNVRLIDHDNKSHNYQCDHYAVEVTREGSVVANQTSMGDTPAKQPGIVIEMSRWLSNNKLTIFHAISLPDHGNTVYVTNSSGVTIDKQQWPLK